MSPSMRSRWRRYRMLLFVIVAVFFVRQWLNHVHFNPTNDTFDAKLFFAFAVIVGISALIMLRDTYDWTMRAVGVFGFLIFSGGLYALSTQYTIWKLHQPTQGDWNWVRATALVSAFLLLLSQIRYIGGRIRDWRAARREKRKGV